ncbi:hypothetical protein, partial [Burkholderia sp. BCC1999]|uniref:hypothetical protein n=1 Tax=Burkholderia sp. BCC1999 TaxID=2817448 RepID=UPI002AC3581A
VCEFRSMRYLIEAIARRDVDGAATLMGAHVVKARRTPLALMEQEARRTQADSPENVTYP